MNSPYQDLREDTRRYANRIRDAYSLDEATALMTEWIDAYVAIVIGEDETEYGPRSTRRYTNKLRAEQRIRANLEEPK